MSLAELYMVLAAFFGTTLSLILYFRESCTKLEVRANNVIRDKKQIVSKSYLELIEKTIERFKTRRTLTDELEEEFERVSYVRYRLNNFCDSLAEVGDKLTKSILSGVASVVFLIFFAYTLMTNLDSMSFWLQIIIGPIAVILLYRYMIDGLSKIPSLRNFEKLVNKIQRSTTFNQLYESLN